MYTELVQAHKHVMDQIRFLERTLPNTTEEAYAVELQIQALHIKGQALRDQAKQEEKVVVETKKRFWGVFS